MVKGVTPLTMLVMMLAMLAAGWLFKGHMGTGHGGDEAVHAHAAASAARTGNTAPALLSETHADGEIVRNEYLRERDDLAVSVPERKSTPVN